MQGHNQSGVKPVVDGQVTKQVSPFPQLCCKMSNDDTNMDFEENRKI